MARVPQVSAALLIMSTLCAPSATQAREIGVLPEGDLRLDRAAEVRIVLPLAGGNFLAVGGIDRADGARVSQVALLDPAGRHVAAFQPFCSGATPVPGRASCNAGFVPLRDGSFLMLGNFTEVAGRAIAGMARFRGDGTLDESFRAPWAASVIPRYSVVGEANGFVYVREGDIPYGNRVRRFRLSAPGQLDPFYSPDDVQGAVVVDENAFLYELYWLGNEHASLRRRTASNVIDANWGSTVPARYIGIGYDSAIGRIFLTTSPSSPQGADVAIVTAGGTIDPDWSLERLPSSVRPGQLYVVGHRPGRLLTRQEVGGRAHLVLHDMATGRIITSASGPSIAQYYFQPAADGSWYATDNTGNVGVPIADPIVRLGPTLERDHTLRTQLRRPGIALHAARGRDGGLFVVGDFQEAGGQARARLARLQPDFQADPGWMQPQPPYGQRSLSWVGQGSDGTLAAAEHETRTAFRYPLWVFPGSGGGATALRSFTVQYGDRAPFGSILVDDDVYGGEICWSRTPLTPAGGLWRFRLSSDLVQPPAEPISGCTPSPGWGPVADAYSHGPFGHGDGHIYYVTPFGSAFQLRRISTAAGSTPDPGFVVSASGEPNTWRMPISSMHAAGGHLYIAGRFGRLGGLATGGLARIDTATGRVDTAWPATPVPPRDASLAIAGGQVYLLSDPDPELGRHQFDLAAYGVSDGRVSNVLSVEVSDVLPTYARPRPKLLSLDDGRDRVVVTGNFWRIDGVERDGFAIVGVPDRLQTDGFEARQ